MHIKFNAYIFCIYMHIFCMFVHMYAIEVNLWGKCIAYFCIFLHIFAYFYAYLCIFMLMHILAYNAHQDKYVAYYAYFRNAYLCIVSFAYFCMFYAYMCLWIFAYEWIFVICIDLYILAYKTYILHISFVHMVHIFCIFGTAYSCIFWNAFFCILMQIMHLYAYFEFSCICNIYISFRHSLEQIGNVGFCGRFKAWFKVSRDRRMKPDWRHRADSLWSDSSE